MGILNGSFEQYQLDNGLVVALQKTQTHTVSGKLRVNFGAYHERDNEIGLAHLLEHCLVTGGSVKHTPTQVENLRTSIGRENAGTSIGRTVLYADMLPEDLESWLDMTSETVFNPLLDGELFEGERGRVVREIYDERGSDSFWISRDAARALYRNHPCQMFVPGNVEVVKNATTQQIREFHKRGYGASNMELILVGNLPENIDSIVKEDFGSRPTGESTRVEFPTLRPLEGQSIFYFPGGSVKPRNPEESSAYFDFALAVAPEGHKDVFALRTLGQLINSRLFKSLGHQKGFSYSCGAEYSSMYNAGRIDVVATVPALKLEEALDTTFGDIAALREKEISVEELDRIKRKVKFTSAEIFESNGGHIYAIEANLDYGIVPEKYLQGFTDLTPAVILQVARDYLPSSRKYGNYVLRIKDPLRKEE